MNSINRRTWLHQSFLSVGALGVGNLARGLEPIQRPGKPFFKLSLAAYSLRQYLQASPDTKGALNMLGFIDYCAKMELEGAEVTSYYFPKEISSAYLNEVKRRAHLAGVSLSGGAIGNDYCQVPGEKLDATLALTRKWIDHYADLGVGVIRVFAGNVPRGDSEDAAIRRCTGVLERVCEWAGKRGVILALENHGGITARAEQMLRIVKGVHSPWFGVNFDSGNFHSEDPYAELEMIAPYAVNAQIKVEISRKGKKSEPTNLQRVVQILRKAGYSGWLTLEYESKLDPYTAIPGHLAALRKVLREVQT